MVLDLVQVEVDEWTRQGGRAVRGARCAWGHTLCRTGGAGGVEVEERGKSEDAGHEVGLAGNACQQGSVGTAVRT